MFTRQRTWCVFRFVYGLLNVSAVLLTNFVLFMIRHCMYLFIRIAEIFPHYKFSAVFKRDIDFFSQTVNLVTHSFVRSKLVSTNLGGSRMLQPVQIMTICGFLYYFTNFQILKL